jgi:hypothetical protein
MISHYASHGASALSGPRLPSQVTENAGIISGCDHHKFDTKRVIMGVWRSANVLIEPDDVTSLLVSASLKGTSSEHENPSHPPAVYT